MFFTLAIFFISVLLFNLKIVVRTIEIKNPVISAAQEKAVFVNFRLDKIHFPGKDRKRTVYIMQSVSWRLKELFCSVERRTFAGRHQHPGIDQIRQDCIQIILELIAAFDLPAYGIHLEAIVNGLEEKIAAGEKFLLMIVHEFIGMKRNHDKSIFLFAFISRRFKAGLFISPGQDPVPVSLNLTHNYNM
mgnify:CR=1 FL=1